MVDEVDGPGTGRAGVTEDPQRLVGGCDPHRIGGVTVAKVDPDSRDVGNKGGSGQRWSDLCLVDRISRVDKAFHVGDPGKRVEVLVLWPHECSGFVDIAGVGHRWQLGDKRDSTVVETHQVGTAVGQFHQPVEGAIHRVDPDTVERRVGRGPVERQREDRRILALNRIERLHVVTHPDCSDRLNQRRIGRTVERIH